MLEERKPKIFQFKEQTWVGIASGSVFSHLAGIPSPVGIYKLEMLWRCHRLDSKKTIQIGIQESVFSENIPGDSDDRASLRYWTLGMSGEMLVCTDDYIYRSCHIWG